MLRSNFASKLWPPLEATVAASAVAMVAAVHPSDNNSKGNNNNNKLNTLPPHQQQQKKGGMFKKAQPKSFRERKNDPLSVSEQSVSALSISLASLFNNTSGKYRERKAAALEAAVSAAASASSAANSSNVDSSNNTNNNDSSFFFSSTGILPRISRDPCKTVPPLDYGNGRIVRRSFDFVKDKFCAVCGEPVESYIMHVGRKDHALLDQHFEAIVEYQRAWIAEDVLVEADRVFKSNKNSSNNNSRRHIIEQCHSVMANEERMRRVELNAMLSFLLDRGALDTAGFVIQGATRGSLFGFFLNAHLAIHFSIPGAILRMSPAANIEQCSSIEDYVSATYNHETTYDMAGFAMLPKFAPATTLNQKSTVVRNLLSQLKSAVIDDEDIVLAHEELLFEDREEALAVALTAAAASQSDDGDVIRKSEGGENFNGLNEENDDEDLDFLTEFAREQILLANRAATDSSSNAMTSTQRSLRLKRIAELENNNNGSVFDATTTASTSSASAGQEQDKAENSSGRLRTGAAEALMGICGKALIADLIHCRISEYIVRAEPTWRRLGQLEQLLPNDTLITASNSRGSGAASSSVSSSSSCLFEGSKIRITMSNRPETVPRPWKPEPDQPCVGA